MPEQPISLRTVKGPNEPVHVLFSSSWHQESVGFFVRGGVDLLEAFDRVAARDSRLHLTVRCAIPGGWCKDRFGQLQAKYGGDRVRNLSAYLAPEEWRGLLLSSDIFALPAARIHVVSLLDAMAHGVTVLTSDGGAIEEYVTDREPGLSCHGQSGREVSWVDKATGMLPQKIIPACIRQTRPWSRAWRVLWKNWRMMLGCDGISPYRHRRLCVPDSPWSVGTRR